MQWLLLKITERKGTAMISSLSGVDRSDWGTIGLLSLGFGLVGIDRFMISTLFPVIARDLALTYDDIGVITGALAFAWGVAALIMGNKADRLGRRKVLVGSLLVFALLIGTSGLATGLAAVCSCASRWGSLMEPSRPPALPRPSMPRRPGITVWRSGSSR